MEIYLVGGAVRDYLLAKIRHSFTNPTDESRYWAEVEKDWVVVGSTPEQMLQQGYRRVGKSFPVFLHPKTQEEYALARIERKTGKGYTGFECYAKPDVTLEDDLKRRDLTINAIAMKVANQDYAHAMVIDPYFGMNDLNNRIFRHVSAAFSEDPVRILRVARLASRFEDFNIASETLELMRQMVEEGEVDALVPERVWQEMMRALQERAPWRFFETLEQSHAKNKLFPQVTVTPKKEILKYAISKDATATIRFAILLSDLSPKAVEDLCQQYAIPNEFRDLAILVTTFRHYYVNIFKLSPEEILNVFERTDAFRRKERFDQFLLACSYIEKLDAKNQKFLETVLSKMMTIDNKSLVAQGLKGNEFADALRKLRLEIIERSL